MKISGKLVRLIEMMMTNSQAAVMAKKRETEDFGINQSLKQRDGLSTALFFLALDVVIKKCNIKETMINKEVQVIAYADDLTVLDRDKRNRVEVIQNIEQEAKKIPRKKQIHGSK